MEYLSSAELAKRVKAKAPNKERAYDQGVSDLVEAAGRVRQCLAAGMFEKSADGHIKINPRDTSDRDYAGTIIGAVDVRFVDAAGYSVKLGGIDFSSAHVNISPNETEPLYPSDERWDAIVGAIGRAILHCQKEDARRAPDALA